MRPSSVIRVTWSIVLTFAFLSVAHGGGQDVLKVWKLDSLDEVLTKSGVEIDKTVSSDGNGSLKIIATQPTVIRLFETDELGVDNAQLAYQAHLRTQDVKGKVFLEMWCRFPDKGEFFSRGLQSALTGTVGWTSNETPFFLRKGEKPDKVKLNVVIDGTGTVWVDDVKLVKRPLK